MADKIFRALLKLLPGELRGDHGEEMESTFRAERRETRGLRLARLWAATVGDLFRTAPAEHWDVLSRDARFALRTMAARPALTLAAIVTLALGIGANLAMFAVVDAVLLAPLPYRDPDGLVVVQERAEDREAGNLGYLTFVDLQARTRSFASLAAASQSFATLTGDGRDPERVGAMRVSASYFPMLGVAPAQGRSFTEAEDRPGPARRVAILSDSLWRRRFGGDRSVLGRPLSFSGNTFTVVGVMPPAFRDLVATRLFEGAELWVPLGYDPAADFACRSCRHLRVFGRLAPAVDAGQAQRLALGAAAAEIRRMVLLRGMRPVLVGLMCGLFAAAASARVLGTLLYGVTERDPATFVAVAAVLCAAATAACLVPAWRASRIDPAITLRAE